MYSILYYVSRHKVIRRAVHKTTAAAAVITQLPGCVKMEDGGEGRDRRPQSYMYIFFFFNIISVPVHHITRVCL